MFAFLDIGRCLVVLGIILYPTAFRLHLVVRRRVKWTPTRIYIPTEMELVVCDNASSQIITRHKPVSSRYWVNRCWKT